MQPLFILGNPRSGTSLFRIILNAHPNIVIPPESGFLQWWYPKYKSWNSQNVNHRDIETYVHDVLSSKKIEAYSINADELITYILKKQPESYASLSACVYRYYGRLKEISIWGDKNNYYIGHIPLLKKLYPDAKFIHLIRDGRDVACSYLELESSINKSVPYRPNLPSDINEIAKEWVTNNALIETELSSTKHLAVRYEDIILSFKDSLGEVLKFLELPWSKNIENYTLHNDEPVNTVLWKKNTLKELQPSLVGRHKRDLTKEQINYFESIAFKYLLKYKYVHIQ